MNKIFAQIGTNNQGATYPLNAFDQNTTVINQWAVVWQEFLTPINSCCDFIYNTLKLNRSDKDQILKQLNCDALGDLTIALAKKDQGCVYCKMGSKPLVIGISPDGYYLAQSVDAIKGICTKYIPLAFGESAKITKDKAVVFNQKGHKIKKVPSPISISDSFKNQYTPQIFDYIYQCQNALNLTVNALCTDSKINLDHLKITKYNSDKISKITIVADNDSFNASICAKEVFELLCDIPTTVSSSIDFINGAKIADKNTLFVAISPSGENTGVCVCASLAKNLGARVVGITANTGSYLSRICTFLINTQCPLDHNTNMYGFLSTYTALCFLALYIGNKREIVSELYQNVSIKMAQMLCGKLKESARTLPNAKVFEGAIQSNSNLIITGCGIDYPIALSLSHKLSNFASRHTTPMPMHALKQANVHQATILAIVSNKDYLNYTTKILQASAKQNANIIIATTANIESSLTDFNNVLAFSDSIPIFNSLPILTGLTNIALVKQNQSRETA